MNERNYLELHYYLQEHGHAMDARVLNKAEAEFIKIANEVAELLGLQVTTNSLPKKEGGLETYYEFIVGAPGLTLMATAIGSFFGTILKTVIADVIADKIKSDSQTEKLKKENLKLEIELKKRQLESFDTTEKESLDFKSIKNELAILIAETNKVKIAKSNFYRNVSREKKVYQFATREVDQNLEPVTPESIIPREHFSKFIIEEADIEPDYKNQIELEVVSPVLKKSRAKWRGIYMEKAFNFKMQDKEFQQLVIQKNLSFSSGTILICDLEIKQKLDTDGDIKIKGYEVYDVTQIIYSDGEVIDIKHDEKQPPF